MAPRQTILDPHLALKQPIQCLVALAILHPAKDQDRAHTRCCRLFVDRPHEAKLGAWCDQPVDQHCHHEIATAPRVGILRRAQDQSIQGDLADHPERCCNMAMR